MIHDKGGGRDGGNFTPTESAAVRALGAGVIARAKGALTRATRAESFASTARSTAMIFMIGLGAAVYNGFLAQTQMRRELAWMVLETGLVPLWVLAGMLLPHLVSLLDEVQARGPVLRARDRTDLRAHVLEPTPERPALFETAQAALFDHDARMLSVMPMREHAVLLRVG